MKNEKTRNLTPKQQRMLHFDEIKHSIRRVEGILEVIILMFVYYFLWKSRYREISTMPQYFGNGKLVLMGVYAILVLVLFYLCDSFKFGHLKISDVLPSQWIALCIVNIVTYFQLCLMANRMINPVPIVLLTLIDMVISLILVYVFTWIYHNNYVPRDMVMIYGNNNAINLKFKMDSRTDKYRVTKILNINKGFDAICEEIANHDAVIINDVPAQIRNDIMKYCYQRGIRTYMVPKISDIITRGAEDITLFDTPLLLMKGRGLTPAQRLTKRMLDIVLCMIALIPSALIMIIVAIAIKLEDGGPVFYKQKRLTKDNQEFNILKFRSMIVDAEKGGYSLNMRACNKDPRITKVGSVIRACRIDELPQIINILKGDMSWVGPRSERVENVEYYLKAIPEFAYRTKVKGGLTGYAQIYGKYNTSAYDKLRLDLMYIENYSIFLDIKLILMTLQILIKPESTEGFDKSDEIDILRENIIIENNYDSLMEKKETITTNDNEAN